MIIFTFVPEWLLSAQEPSHGSSGGPVLNKYGEVIGVAVGAIEQGQNLNFAIPVAKLKTLMNRATSNVTPLAPAEVSSSRPTTGKQPDADSTSDWKPIVRTADSTIYFNTRTLARLSTQVIQAWIMRRPTDDVSRMSEAKRIRADAYAYTVSLERFNCELKQTKLSMMSHYDSKGSVISSNDYENESYSNWLPVVPDSTGETVLNSVCAEAIRH